MRPFSLLIKPTGADCNLRCAYCFYLEKSGLYPETKKHRMSRDVLDRLVSSYMATEQPIHTFAWQGGEPTLMGVDFFRTVTDLQQRYGRSGDTVANGLQTNATLIDDELAEHLARFKFLVGCSLDGPASLHDAYRCTVHGSPTHAAVMRGIETLRRHGVTFNILVLVSSANVGHAKAVYRYLLDHGFDHHQYIPCVEFDDAGKPEPYTITGEQWGRFLCELFDEWHGNGAGCVSVRNFDVLLLKLAHDQEAVCTMGRDCRQYFVVEHNGDLYPCDFFVQDRLRLGNIRQTSWAEALESRIYHDFGVQKSQWNEACDSCEHLSLCHGDCLKHRNNAGDGPTTLSWLCPGLKTFFSHTKDRLVEMSWSVAPVQITWHSS